MANREGNKKSGLSLLRLMENKQGMKGNICETFTESWVLPLDGKCIAWNNFDMTSEWTVVFPT